MPGRLLAPLSREEFLKHCWAEKAVAAWCLWTLLETLHTDLSMLGASSRRILSEVHGHPRRLAPIISRLSDLDLEASARSKTTLQSL